jgi:multidrug efflux pump subunit AcrA (membrane-fusion protein)
MKIIFQKNLPPIPVWLLVGSLLVSGCQVIKDITSPEPTAAPVPVQQSDSTFIAEGRIVPNDFANLTFTTAGKVIEISVQEGSFVSKGSALVTLGDREPLEASLAAAELELLSAQQQLADLNEKASLASSQANLAVLDAEAAFRDAQQKLEEIDTTETQDKIDDARKIVVDIRDELKDAQDEFDKYKDLDTDDQNRKDAEDKLKDAQVKYDQAVRDRDTLMGDLARAKAALVNTQFRLDRARLDAADLQSGPDPDQLALVQARLKNAQAQVTAAQSALDKLVLTAPYDGKVLKIDISVGERVLPNQTVIILADTASWFVETNDLTENEVINVSLGQSVTIRPDALPELEIRGTVAAIADTYVERSGDVTYIVRIQLDQTDPLLRWGMTVEVQFEE